jgi:predicted  nucleic acid-binding Zn-ribbon protein
MTEGMLPDERDRLVRVEEGITIIKDMYLEDREARKKLEEKVGQHEKFIDKMQERATWIASAFAVLINLVVFAVQWLINHTKIGWN